MRYVQMANRTQSRLLGLAAIVGVEVISKGTGRCSAFLLATVVKKTQSGI